LPPAPPPPPPLPPTPPPLPPAPEPHLPPQAAAPGFARPSEDGHIPRPHELLNPTQYTPVLGAPFTANTQPEWQDPSNNLPIDPLSSSPSAEGLFSHSPIVQPPTVNSARSAVEGALASAPFDAAAVGPTQALNAQPLGPELHPPPTPSANGNSHAATPSLTLPTNGAPPTPPPMPPPIPFMPPPPKSS
jgi:hypothetical protein